MCMVLLSLVYALIRSNRVLFGLTCSFADVGILLVLPAHASALFITLYIIFLILRLLVALAIRINCK